MALNRQAIVDSVRNGVDLPAYHFTPKNIGGYTSPSRVEEDYDEARRLLAEAGYPGGEGFPQVELLYSTSDLGKYLTEVMQQMWQQNLGVRVSINNQEWKVFLSTTDQRDFDIAVMSWASDYLDPVNFLELFTTENGNNRSGYASPHYDALIEQGRMTNDRAERYRLFGEAETILLQDAPLAPVYNKSRSFLCRPEVQNFPANLMDYRRFDRMVFAAE
jgi:oligopeptide transport system substrate-binding protein